MYPADKQWDSLWINAKIVTMCNASYSIIEQGAIAVSQGCIAWVGPQTALPENYRETNCELRDCQGRWVTPGLIDCHTHIIYAGNRAHEFTERLQGRDYAAILASGGGILSTVKATRAASFKQLLSLAIKRCQFMMQQGVTTLEIKSGYGLDVETEIKILAVARQLNDQLPLDIVMTCLAAHVIPPEYLHHPDDYVRLVCEDIIPAVSSQKLAHAVDVFCDAMAFSPEQTARIFAVAQDYGLARKIHAEQLSYQGAALCASAYGALSADHCEYLDEASVVAMAKSGMVAVLLPGAYYFLQQTQLPPIKWLRHYRVPIAIATDSNPGTSPTLSLLLMLNMACVLFKLTPEEALAGVTCHAARALGQQELLGQISQRWQADFAIWDIAHPDDLAYQFGVNPCVELVKKGRVVYQRNHYD